MPLPRQVRAMNRIKFRDALVAHFERTGVTAAELSRRTGVAKTQIDKLRQGKATTTNVDDAILIAEFFGKTVNDFVSATAPSRIDRIVEIVSALSQSEQEFLLRQIESLSAPIRS